MQRLVRQSLFWSSALVPIVFASVAHAQAADPAPAQAAASTSATAAPATGGPLALGEIVVTATRQSQVLSKVPISVSAYSQQTMDRQGITAIDDLAKNTPGLYFTRSSGSGNGNSNNITIRGITSVSGFATTGVYIDETPIAVRTVFPANNTYPRVFDLDRVEVLRGPQGTLFGAGAEGGVVRFITPTPSLIRFSGYARAEGSGIEGGGLSGEFGAAVGGPIVEDKLGFRISAWGRHDGGWVDRINVPSGSNAVVSKDSNSNDTVVGRAALAWKPTDRLTITPSIYVQKQYTHDTPNLWESLSNPGHGQYYDGFGLAQPGTDRFVLPALAIHYDFGPVALDSNTSLFDRNQVIHYDYTSTVIGSVFARTNYPWQRVPGYQVAATMGTKQDTITQELRLSSTNPEARLRWVVGAFVDRMHQSTLQADYDPQFPALIMAYRGLTIPQAFGPLARTDVVYDRLNHERTWDEQYAAFGQGDLRLIDGLSLTVGLRVSKTKFHFNHDELGMAVSENHTSGKADEMPVTPKYGLNWQIDPHNLVYFSAAKGFRIGGANPAQNPIACSKDFSILGITANPIQYNSDTVWSYEIGSKNTFADGRVQVAASAFRIDWSNIQRSVGLPSCALSYITNLGAAQSQGFDVSGQALPIDGLTLGYSLGYNKAVYTQTIKSTSGAIIVQKGDSLGVPVWQGNLSAQYEFNAFADHRGYVRADWQYIGKIKGISSLNRVTSSYDPTLYPTPSRTLTNVRAGVRIGNYDVSLFADNLFDNSAWLQRSHTFGLPLFFLSTEQPRTVGVTVVARY